MNKPSKALRIQRAARAALRAAGIDQVHQEAMRTSAAGSPGCVRIARHRDDPRFDPPRSPAEAGARWLTLRVEVPALAQREAGEVIPPEEVADPVIQAVKAALAGQRLKEAESGELLVSNLFLGPIEYEQVEAEDGGIDPDELLVCLTFRCQYQDD